jgi:tetratricopeptide (TPR) repeat protein
LKIDPINSEALQLADEIAEIEDKIKASKIEEKITPPPPPTTATTTTTTTSDSSRVSESEHFKSLGNEAMKQSDYQEALRLYSKSIELDSNNIVAISNRAQVYIKLCRYIDAERDAS